ncbi:precorrin-6A reductase [Ammoniphilus sp. YIM 78166]|uniref:precorrin-6A reductase n=1 Tax=Ammoniphilus sp. YIM 78166 TaxID=1644106 RepID=UPI00106F1E47|nr:precorrin-6A reductase [Ammoniphilus sp. YIM 78166]
MILVLAGTSDARELAVKIKEEGYSLLATVVTDNAAKAIEEASIPVRVGRLTAEEITQLIQQEGFQAVVDASHPYAEEASRNAMAGAKTAEVPYLRYERENLAYPSHEKVTIVEDYAQAAEVAAQRRGNIMLTTGSKTLKVFTERLLGLPETTLIARMLPRRDNMEKCEELGVEQKNIIAMQGPFSKELNKALYDQYQVTLMITKESGKVGAVDEKVEAALEMGIETIIIARPQIDYGTKFSSFDGVLTQLKQTLQGGVAHGL